MAPRRPSPTDDAIRSAPTPAFGTRPRLGDREGRTRSTGGRAATGQEDAGTANAVSVREPAELAARTRPAGRGAPALVARPHRSGRGGLSPSGRDLQQHGVAADVERRPAVQCPERARDG